MTDLTYSQRKALRRLGRGQSISGEAHRDPLIAKCFEYRNTEPPKPLAEMNVVEWCDWEARIASSKPTLTPFGERLLAELNDRTEEQEVER